MWARHAGQALVVAGGALGPLPGLICHYYTPNPPTKSFPIKSP